MYEPSEWEAKGLSGSDLADQDLKTILEGLAKHLFGDVEVRSVYTLLGTILAQKDVTLPSLH